MSNIDKNKTGGFYHLVRVFTIMGMITFMLTLAPILILLMCSAFTVRLEERMALVTEVADNYLDIIVYEKDGDREFIIDCDDTEPYYEYEEITVYVSMDELNRDNYSEASICLDKERAELSTKIERVLYIIVCFIVVLSFCVVLIVGRIFLSIWNRMHGVHKVNNNSRLRV